MRNAVNSRFIKLIAADMSGKITPVSRMVYSQPASHDVGHTSALCLVVWLRSIKLTICEANDGKNCGQDARELILWACGPYEVDDVNFDYKPQRTYSAS